MECSESRLNTAPLAPCASRPLSLSNSSASICKMRHYQPLRKCCSSVHQRNGGAPHRAPYGRTIWFASFVRRVCPPRFCFARYFFPPGVVIVFIITGGKSVCALNLPSKESSEEGAAFCRPPFFLFHNITVAIGAKNRGRLRKVVNMWQCSIT
jgi:hypothetical protein